MRFQPEHVSAIAARIAAESVSNEPPCAPDLSDAGIRRYTDKASLNASDDNIAAIRDHFTANYSH